MRGNKTGRAGPVFFWDAGKMLKAEWLLVVEATAAAGAAVHVPAASQNELAVNALAEDITANIEIEGEILPSGLLRESISHRLGFNPASNGNTLTDGCAELVLDVVRDQSLAFNREWILRWRDFFGLHYGDGVGTQPPLTARQNNDLRDYLQWFNSPTENEDDTPLVRVGIAHLWFESLNLLPMGTGIVGRLLAQRMLARGLPSPVFIPLNPVLLRRRRDYLRHLDNACQIHDATNWLLWFSATVIESIRMARVRVDASIRQRQLLDSLRKRISSREQAILMDFFHMGQAAFMPGISPGQYASQTGLEIKAVAADMANLAALKALTRSVRANATRYHLALPAPDVRQVEIEDIL